LELAQYLIANRQYALARVELLIAGGNVPETAEFDRTLAELFEKAEDVSDAWTYYQKALALRPKDPALLNAAGQLAFRMGNFDAARRLLTRAEAVEADEHLPETPDAARMREDAARIMALVPLPSLPLRDRGDRVIRDRRIAKQRLDACIAHFQSTGAQIPPELQSLETRWSGPDESVDARTLRGDSDRQDATMNLVYATELQAEPLCGPAQGDDALLLRVAKQAPQSTAPATSVESAAQPDLKVSK
jgi:tetratricopeptide (TPR) repeat protein